MKKYPVESEGYHSQIHHMSAEQIKELKRKLRPAYNNEMKHIPL